MEPSILKDKVILIVDDYQINTELLSFFVTDTGAIALTASNGKECIEIVEKQHVDIILMDNNMPVMDGIEATKVIRSLPQGKDIIIIGISGSDEGKDADICLQAGMNTVSPKLTFNDEKLLEIARKFLCNSDTTAEQHANSKTFTDPTSLESNNNIDNQSIMDYEKALKEFENDSDLLSSLIVDFNKIIHSQLTMMQQALDKSDFDYIGKESHGIKGGAANLCAMPLSDAAKSLEVACKQHEGMEVISGFLDNLACVIDTFDKFVKDKIPQ